MQTLDSAVVAAEKVYGSDAVAGAVALLHGYLHNADIKGCESEHQEYVRTNLAHAASFMVLARFHGWNYLEARWNMFKEDIPADRFSNSQMASLITNLESHKFSVN